MIILSTPYNGVVITIIGIIISAVFFFWAYRLYRRQRSIPQPLERVDEQIKGRLEDVSQADAELIVAKSIELEVIHGHNDLLGLFADRASGVPLNELSTRNCSQYGIPRNQKGRQSE